MNILEILKTIKEDVDFENSKDFFEEGLLDSFDIMVLVEAIEEAYDIEISGADILPENFKSVEAIEELIGKYE